jgi:hypothetical protein
MSHPDLRLSIDPSSPYNQFDKLLHWSLKEDDALLTSLSENERKWIEALHQCVSSEISLSLSCEDFRQFFRMKQENTASSPSGRHFGHYRSLLECFRQNNLLLPSLITNIAFVSSATAHPLQRWQLASQVMLEKGKGRFIDHLRIIQLCEADLNFVLHVIWGHRLIRHAKMQSAFSTSQYAIPGQTCNNAVLNKDLFCDLSRQTLSPGVLTDFDATAAFDWVIAGLSIITANELAFLG